VCTVFVNSKVLINIYKRWFYYFTTGECSCDNASSGICLCVCLPCSYFNF